MKKKVLALVIGILLIGGNVFAAGDLIVDGKLGVGTTSPEDKVVIQLSGDMGSGVSGLVLKAPDSQNAPALTFIGGGPNGGDTGKIVYDSGNDWFNFWGGGIGIPEGKPIIWGGTVGDGYISMPSNGIMTISGASTINLLSASNGKTLIPSGDVGIGTTAPAAKLQVTGGNAYVSDAGNGLIVKSPDGAICKRIGIDNNGDILLSAVTCP